MEIPAFLKAGLSFSESPKYKIRLPSTDAYPNSEMTVSKAMPCYTLCCIYQQMGAHYISARKYQQEEAISLDLQPCC